MKTLPLSCVRQDDFPLENLPSGQDNKKFKIKNKHKPNYFFRCNGNIKKALKISRNHPF
jgi:hypothetical protein